MPLRDRACPRRPMVGINGEIYLRANRFCNKDLRSVCEANGLEVEVAPMSEWLKYITLPERGGRHGRTVIEQALRGAIRKARHSYYEGKVSGWFDGAIHEKEPGTKELLETSSLVLPSRCGSEAVLSLG